MTTRGVKVLPVVASGRCAVKSGDGRVALQKPLLGTAVLPI